MKESNPFDWSRIFFGEDMPLSFLGEVVLRSFIMYVLILITLRVMGKRGVKQLSLFEFSIILALGSAAGDPMFYEDVPLTHALVVFVVIIALYLLFNFLTEHNDNIERWFEGSSACIIENGEINLVSFKKQKLTYMELFGEMRQQQVEHLGQVKKVYLESTGEISLFFFEADATKPGLPIFPEILLRAQNDINYFGLYACNLCGHVLELSPGDKQVCPKCQNNKWLQACQAKRIS
ncbi:MAG: hypothetical protein JWQ14_3442 [Adhaeribacter sp.]|nr:hypothetical protein [Adhaeribacter sp.]